MASLAESGIVSEALLLSKSGKTPTESGAIIVSESMLDNLARLAYRTID
ncbi:MAG TPA: hypothetical protein PK765_07340 [bacterium]|nr:hypothetical protein [bacterium]